MALTAERHDRAGMQKNVGEVERIVSAIGGAAIVVNALRRPSIGNILLALGGAALVQRGVSGNCAFYRMLGIDHSSSGTTDRRANADRTESGPRSTYTYG